MNFQMRKQLILQTLEQKDSAGVSELAELLHTSAITVRRDLALLAEKGLLVRTHGGAVRPGFAKDPVSFINKAAVNQEQKEYICHLAVKEIKEGDTIFLDCGSTTFLMCPLIRHLSIRVVTNSLPVVNALLGSAVTVNMVGGEIDHKRQAAHGLMAAEHVYRYKADLAFLGVDGISVANGLSANSETEAEMTLAMAANARRAILLCDSSKLEKDKYFQFAALSPFHAIITDKKITPALLAMYRQAGVNIVNGESSIVL
ncbi:DeoR/GlpR family DNA-binding transcription regulator [Arsenicibacter rosenii]|uniref:DeoR family transcriptional regulator n=1 Tax=Arsenicibacter rosenii TaxID=1750698 RepID=A0A1S2VDP0_9BACT|nr:DeoR/GlpR family DNA-binding transcription regulator [Arsenicibacter rosenii]OIN56844.1 DeoR family transcriptional regulator [Arsenicibacter rosenii]